MKLMKNEKYVLWLVTCACSFHPLSPEHFLFDRNERRQSISSEELLFDAAAKLMELSWLAGITECAYVGV